ncbi:uncharacterized protein HKW66_Vig0179140 [Vigna angularis]|uniref:Uncharacterized protein n=1 Tax=Phaseolus angularis TaxID=3914 RepID=A0A8T0JY91_PHAAN|nr:uncharacterized protein HKW66_Vig0179140 [Vigna angularis]
MSSKACCAFVVYKAFVENLEHLFELHSSFERVVMGFDLNYLPNCFGVLGLARFKIDDSLLREIGCLMVQALVDSEGRFLDVSVGWSSAMNPETISNNKNIH